MPREQGSLIDIVNWVNFPGQRTGEKMEVSRKMAVKNNQHLIAGLTLLLMSLLLFPLILSLSEELE